MAPGPTNISHVIATKNSTLPLWARSLRSETEETEHSGFAHTSWQPAPAETPELRSLSHEGRVRFHSRKFVPPGNGVEKKTVLVRPEHEEQLLYVALYRDKIAEQQANLELQRNKDAARGRMRQRLQSAAPNVVGEAAEFSLLERELPLAGAEPSISASAHEASAMDAPPAASSAMGAVAPPFPPLESARRGAAAPAQENKKATHIASVSSALGAGGVASEYLETKRLGKLFDEWKLQQAALGEDATQNYGAQSSSARRADKNARFVLANDRSATLAEEVANTRSRPRSEMCARLVHAGSTPAPTPRASRMRHETVPRLVAAGSTPVASPSTSPRSSAMKTASPRVSALTHGMAMASPRTSALTVDQESSSPRTSALTSDQGAPTPPVPGLPIPHGASPAAPPLPKAKAKAAGGRKSPPGGRKSPPGGRKSPPGGKGQGRGAKAATAAAPAADIPTSARSFLRRSSAPKKRPSVDASVEKRDRVVSGDRSIDNSDFGGSSDYGSDTSEHRGAHINESKLVSRLFQVVTNPKVTGEALCDGDSAKKVPSYVEGFPPLNLMRLYRGPWRLEC